MSLIELEENKENKLNFYLWVEKFRPARLKDVIIPTDIKKFFGEIIKEKETPNLLFYSAAAGTGKTSTAKVIAKEIGTNYLYLNTSLENGIDVLRSYIEKFATSMSFEGLKKIVIMDEFCGATPFLQQAIKAFIEEFHQSCRFIFIANHITKIIEPIKSRCQIIDFNMSTKEIQEEMKPLVFQRLVGILKFEKIKNLPIVVDEVVLKKIVDVYYPDIRKMINLLQQYSKQNGSIDKGIFNYESVDDELYQLILAKKLTAARKFIIEKNYNFSELYRQLFNYLVPKMEKSKQGQTILAISEYMFRDAFVIDKEINFTACMLEIISLL
jgi:replication factor C small subunit